MERPRRVYLLRHATAELAPEQADHHMFSTMDSRLSPKGQAEAARARDALRGRRLDAVVASPAKRAIHTATIVAEPHGLEVHVDDRLLEVPFAPYGSDYDRIMERILAWPEEAGPDPDPVFPNGERFSAVLDRMSTAVAQAQQGRREVAVVAHGIANRVLLASILGHEPRHILRIGQDHACINVIETGPRGPLLRLVNGGHADPVPP